MIASPAQQAAQRRIVAALRQGHIYKWKRLGYLTLLPHYPPDYLEDVITRNGPAFSMQGCSITGYPGVPDVVIPDCVIRTSEPCINWNTLLFGDETITPIEFDGLARQLDL